VSVDGVLSAAGVETAKLAAQVKVRLALAASIIGPFAFAIAMRVQSSLPEDTLFGRSVKDSGFAVPLVVLGFAALWAFPALVSIVVGDIFSAEDRFGTWKTVLTRSRTRTEIHAGKTVVALMFAVLAVATLATSSIAAGAIVIGRQPLIDLSGALLPPSDALRRVALAWASVVPPAFAFAALAMLVSVGTRSSVAGVGLPVVAAMTMQLYGMVDGPEGIRRLLLTSSFVTWHGLLADPPYYRPLVYGTLVSAGYVVVSVAIAYRLLRERDVVG
jgi:ABC-2 type transport system permease protein